MNRIHSCMLVLMSAMTVNIAAMDIPEIIVTTPVVPVFSGIESSPADCITVLPQGKPCHLTKARLDFEGTTDYADIEEAGVYLCDNSASLKLSGCLGKTSVKGRGKISIPLDWPLFKDTLRLCIGLRLRDSIDLRHKVSVRCTEFCSGRQSIRVPAYEPLSRRIGVALHSQGLDDVASCRIPGLTTANDGTLLAIYDLRYDSSRDLQGNIDIGLRRSYDGGSTWTPVQRVLDMGEWGGLPERYNGVSDACILVDKRSGDILVAGLWMHGALDPEGKWIEGLDEKSDYWIHQWKGRGSQPGTGVRETCQFLITRSRDGGVTWSLPQNITSDTKRPEWWLFAPSPGHGITLDDGTLLFPTEGRDENGCPFSNVTYSKDGGKNWTASNPAYENATECNAVQLSSGEVMLNMRDNRNRGHKTPNGRRICITTDLGDTWTEHPTSRNALVEPTCMGSLHRHDYTDKDGKRSSILLFSNPDHFKVRKNMTLKASADDGLTWPSDMRILYDETKGFGYSSITSIDENTVGILYESGIADMVFITFDIKELTN